MISLVELTLSDSRSIKDVKRMVGKAEKSNGRSINNVTVNIKIASPNDAANPTSNTHDGTGKIIMTITAIRASDMRIVGLNKDEALLPIVDLLMSSTYPDEKFH